MELLGANGAALRLIQYSFHVESHFICIWHYLNDTFLSDTYLMVKDWRRQVKPHIPNFCGSVAEFKWFAAFSLS